jgi:hypothetical protein
MLRRVVVGGLVEEIRRFGDDEEAVGEARRQPEHAIVGFRQLDAGHLAEGRRAAADVHGDVEHRAARHAHQLALRLAQLVMQPAQHAAGGAGMVVLHELGADAGRLGQHALVVALEEEAARVAEDLRFEDQRVVDLGLDDLHGPLFYLRFRYSTRISFFPRTTLLTAPNSKVRRGQRRGGTSSQWAKSTRSTPPWVTTAAP